MKATAFKHSGSLGDVIASLPAVREFCRMRDRKAIIYLEKDVLSLFPDGIVHPTRNSDNLIVRLNPAVIDMLTPLLKAQPYIEDAKLWEDEPIDIDLDVVRTVYTNAIKTCISRCYFHAFPDLACDLSEVWLTVPDSEKNLAKDKIIITRTERYQNELIDYSFLKPFEDDCIFSGTMREYNNFCMAFDLEIPKLYIENFLDLAQAIKQSKFHISNQTMAFQISQGLKHPRILETCHYACDIIPIGKDAYDFYGQFNLEYYFNMLNGTELKFKEEYLEKNKASSKHLIDDASIGLKKLIMQ